MTTPMRPNECQRGVFSRMARVGTLRKTSQCSTQTSNPRPIRVGSFRVQLRMTSKRREVPRRPATARRRCCLMSALISGLNQLQLEIACPSCLSKEEAALLSAKRMQPWNAMEATMSSLPNKVVNPITTCSYLYQQPLPDFHIYPAQTPPPYPPFSSPKIDTKLYSSISLSQVRTEGKLALVHLLIHLHFALLVVLVDDAAPSLPALPDLPNEQSVGSLLYPLPKGLPMLKKTNIFHVLRSIRTISMRVTVPKLTLILKIWRKQQPSALSTWQAGDIVAYGAMIEDIVGVQDEGVR